MYQYPNPSLISRGLNILKTVKWGTILDGTGKTLGVINQAIPIVYQVKPLFSNAKTLFSIANEINKEEPKETINNSPIFYI